MQNITDVHFDFGMLEDIIVEKLNEYNICQDDYFGGTETSEALKQKAEALFVVLDFCDGCIMVRKAVISKKLLEIGKSDENRELRKENLITENKYLLGRLDWHKKLKRSIEKRCKQICDIDLGIDDEPDYE